jgi:hypothetical protein
VDATGPAMSYRAEIEALRSRVAAQDAELTRLRGLVGEGIALAKGWDMIEGPDGGWAYPDATDALAALRTLLAEARAEVPR